MEKNGFINYYNLKQFGNKSIPMHKIGKSIVKSDWNGAIKMILSQYNGGNIEEKKLKLYFRS